MTLIHEIFATEDASRVLGMAMMASLGLGIGAIWEERNGSSHAVERLWGAIISGVFVMLAFIMAEQSGGFIAGSLGSVVLFPAGGALYLLSTKVVEGIYRRWGPKRGPKVGILCASGIALACGGLVLGAASAISVYAGLAATFGVGLSALLVARGTTASLLEEIVNPMDRGAVHVILALVFVAWVVGAFWLLHGRNSNVDGAMAILLAGYFLLASVHLIARPFVKRCRMNVKALVAFICGMAGFGLLAAGLDAVLQATGVSDAILQHPSATDSKLSKEGAR